MFSEGHIGLELGSDTTVLRTLPIFEILVARTTKPACHKKRLPQSAPRLTEYADD